jgi:hypothetical protein
MDYWKILFDKKICQFNDNGNRNKFPNFLNYKYYVLQLRICVHNFLVLVRLLFLIPICPFISQI